MLAVHIAATVRKQETLNVPGLASFLFMQSVVTDNGMRWSGSSYLNEPIVDNSSQTFVSKVDSRSCRVDTLNHHTACEGCHSPLDTGNVVYVEPRLPRKKDMAAGH